MSKHEKVLRRLFSKPKDFTWQELVTLMQGLSFVIEKGSGSGRKFVRTETGAILFDHEPHPDKTLKACQIRDVIAILERERLLP